MTVYDDPSQIADILRSAVQGAEEQGASTVMIAPVILEHAARFLDALPLSTEDVLTGDGEVVAVIKNVPVTWDQLMQWRAGMLDRDDGPEDCAAESKRNGLGIDKHRYIFHPWRKGITQCALCVSAVVSGNEEGHAQFHVLTGEFPRPTAVGYPDATEVWAHKTATGWVMKTIRGRLG